MSDKQDQEAAAIPAATDEEFHEISYFAWTRGLEARRSETGGPPGELAPSAPASAFKFS